MSASLCVFACALCQSDAGAPGEPGQAGQTAQQQGQGVPEEGSLQRRHAGQEGQGGPLRGHRPPRGEAGGRSRSFSLLQSVYRTSSALAVPSSYTAVQYSLTGRNRSCVPLTVNILFLPLPLDHTCTHSGMCDATNYFVTEGEGTAVNFIGYKVAVFA